MAYGIGDWVKHKESGEVGPVVFRAECNLFVRLEHSPKKTEVSPGTVRVWHLIDVSPCTDEVPSGEEKSER